MSSLPYVTAPGTISRALNAIKSAATPERVSQDYVKTVLGIKGGSGDQITSYLKKIGFALQDGTPTELYKQFRNTSTSKKAGADAMRKAYQPLFQRNESMYKLSDEDLRGLIASETGQASDSNPVSLTLGCIKNMREFADFESNGLVQEIEDNQPRNGQASTAGTAEKFGLNLSYTINLNLPATSDVSVFNAIFKSLRENLLKE